jgi:thiamine-phosphate pyrophosphorylase
VHRRQIDLPRCWLIADQRLGEELSDAVARLPRGSGVLVLLHGMGTRERHAMLRKLRLRARTRGLIMVDEARERLRGSTTRASCARRCLAAPG